LVTYPEALFEKVVNPRTLSGNMISIKVGENLNIDEILGRFVKLGFRKEDFVYEPGQFAMRGGILDIYSFGNEHPYRIELFGNEVDSIRIFDPENQLSERKLLQVSIIPNVETQFDSGEKVSILDFLPENTVVWSEDWDFIKEKIEQQEEDLELYLELVKQNPVSIAALEEEDNYQSKTEVSEIDFVKAAVIEEQVKESLSKEQRDWWIALAAAQKKALVLQQKIQVTGDNLRIAQLSMKEGVMEYDEFSNIFMEDINARIDRVQNLGDATIYQLLLTQNK
jgi:transcription-repair coupling factor (superfamily II helicase)